MIKREIKLFIFTLLFVLSFIGSAATHYNDGVPILAKGAEPTDAQEDAIRKGASNWCSDRPEEEREQCALDYFVAHNYQGEPSCD